MIVQTLLGSVSGGTGGFPPAVSIPFPTEAQAIPSLGAPNIRNYLAWYSVEIPSGPTDVNFNTIGSNGGNSLDTMLGVYNAQGNRLGYDDDSGGAGWSSLTLSGLDAGVYYIAVGLFPASYGVSDFNAVGNNTGVEASSINLIILNVVSPQ